MPRRTASNIEDHRELGARLKALEAEITQLTLRINCVDRKLAESFRKRMGHVHEYKHRLEERMLRDLRKSCEEAPADWGQVYYGPLSPTSGQDSTETRPDA